MTNKESLKKIEGLSSLIGKTPLVKIGYKYKGVPSEIYAKAEYFNLSGSIKDRMALHILRKACENGEVSCGDTIVEATSGNTGIAFSAIGRSLGCKVVIYMPDWMSKERMSLISSYGAEIRLVSKEQGGFLGSIALAEKFAKENQRVFLPRQFDNHHNCEAHYRSTAQEIWDQLGGMGLKPNIVVAGVGTGGTVMGLKNFFKEKDSSIKVHPLEPSNSPTLSTGHCVGKHRIQGISDEFIPSIVKLNELDSIVEVDDGDSIIMAKMLAQKLGIGVGISSGGNFIGAVKLKAQNPDAVVVTVFADDNKKYLSTDYSKDEPTKEYFLSNDIELISIESIRH